MLAPNAILLGRAQTCFAIATHRKRLSVQASGDSAHASYCNEVSRRAGQVQSPVTVYRKIYMEQSLGWGGTPWNIYYDGGGTP